MPNEQWVRSLTGARADLARESTVSRVATVLRDRIAAGVLLPGTQVAEHPVAQALGVSRNTLREAFRLLTDERLLVHEQHRGVFVRTLDEADVLEIYAARRVVECAAVRDSRPAGTSALHAVRAAVTAGQRAAGRGRWADVGSADLRFHRALTGLAGSRHLDDLMDRVLAELRLAFHALPDRRHFHEPYLQRNDSIAALLERGLRADAARELAGYLDDAERQVLAAFVGTG